MGAIVCFSYAMSFPNECDMVVALDALVPFPTINSLLQDTYRNGLKDVLISDERNISGEEPPCYNFETIVKKLLNGTFSSYTAESLPHLLIRGVKESKSDPNKYYFSRDSRLKTRFNYFPMDRQSLVDMASSVAVPYCYIRALQSDISSKFDFMDEILQTMKSASSRFEVHGVDGDHHVHLTEPEKVSRILGRFISMYRSGNILSKL